MGLFRPRRRDFVRVQTRTIPAVMTKDALNRFGPSILGLGDLLTEGSPVDVICAIFDLEGFTDFAGHTDPHLALPEFFGAYLQWLFDGVRKGAIAKQKDDGVVLYYPLPFYAKFMGDGVIFLWNTSMNIDSENNNIAFTCVKLAQSYGTDLLPRVQQLVSHAPRKMRCGVARGRVVSVGAGEDFVGPCMNLAARLQKLTPFSWAVARNGLPTFGTSYKRTAVLRAASIRGFSGRELVYLPLREFEKLTSEESKAYPAP